MQITYCVQNSKDRRLFLDVAKGANDHWTWFPKATIFKSDEAQLAQDWATKVEGNVIKLGFAVDGVHAPF